MRWEKELEAAKQVAVEAGKAIMDIYQGADQTFVEYKSDQSPLTIADQAANKIIVEFLRNNFSQYAVLSEEEKDQKSRLENDYCFVVDPLDGTKEFLKRNGQFTVNIALAYKHESVMGVIYVPVTGDLYYAAKGAGAFVEHTEGQKTKLSVSDQTDISKFLRYTSPSPRDYPTTRKASYT